MLDIQEIVLVSVECFCVCVCVLSEYCWGKCVACWPMGRMHACYTEDSFGKCCMCVCVCVCVLSE